MKLALCYDSMVPSQGGCETYIADLTRQLISQGHEVHLYAAVIDEQAFPEEAHRHLLPPVRGIRWLRPWRFARACYAAMQQQSFDVTVGFIKTWGQDVLMYQGGFHLASAENNINKHPLRLTRLLITLKNYIDPKHWSYRMLERRQLFDFPTIAIVPSNMVQRHGRKYYQLPDKRMRVLPNAIDESRFRLADRLVARSTLRDANNLLPEDNVGLFVGHNYRLKGLVPLLHAVRLLPASVNFRLMVCGSANYARYQKLARQLGVAERIRFLGFHPDVSEAYFASDFLIHPSFYDPCALVTMEALVCGLPVITTKLNGGCELLPPALASLTVNTPHDHAAMARQIQRLCIPAERTALSRVAREAARNWTYADHCQALLQIFEEVAQTKRPAPVHTRPGLVS